MLSFFMIAGLSYLFFLSSFFGIDKLIGPYVPWLFLLFSFPHFMATYWVWNSRVKTWKKEWLPLLFPVLYLVAFVGSSRGWFGGSALEMLLKCSYLYLLYHFAQQLYGVTLWINGQNKIFYSYKHKLFLRGLFLSTCLYAWLEMEMRGVVKVLFYHSVSSWGLHSDYLVSIFLLVAILSLVNIFWSFYDFYKTKDLKHLLSIGPIGLAWLWFLPPLNKNMIMLLPVLHGIQYLPFIKIKARKLNLSKWLTLSVIFIASGWVFFRWLPLFFPFKVLEGTLWPALILSLLNNHHFLIDGRIWKLKDPENQDLFTSAPELQFQEEKAPS